jgi:tRNA (adenine9-N1/guanine9-N1)-methyltransferase
LRFKKPKELVAERLLSLGLRRPKLIFQPGRGDFFNRIAYRLIKGEWGVIPAGEFGEPIRPGKVIDEVGELQLLALRGELPADAAVVRRRGTVDFSDLPLNYPDFAVDLSLFKELTPKERKSLAVQLEIAYGTVKDYFTPENFYLSSVSREAREFLNSFFSPRSPFPLLESFDSYSKVIVLDPSAEKEFDRQEVDPDTLIVVGGIVDSSQRLKGSTQRILPHALHRKITYKGIVDLVPDRINEIIKIVCDYLTSELPLSEAVKRNLTRDSKLRFIRRFVQENLVRFKVGDGELQRGLPLDLYLRWKEELGLSDFYFRKAAKHAGSFFVFKPALMEKVVGETVVRKKKVYLLKELRDEDVVANYP